MIDGLTCVGEKQGKVRIVENHHPKILGKAVNVFLLGLATILGSWACTGTSTTPDIPEPVRHYNITVINQNIFNNKSIGGDVILNGERKQSGGTFTVEGGQIDTLDVDKVPGFITAYIVGRDSVDNVIYIRDREGPHESTVKDHTTIYTRLIPNDFDTVQLAKTVGDNIAPSGTPHCMGNGIIKNYNKHTIPVGILPEEAQPIPKTYEIVKECIKQINNGAKNPDLGRIIYLDYVGDLTQELSDGCTALVCEYGGGHHETVDGNVIVKSNALIGTTAPNKGMFIEELFQATTGSRWDAGVERCPYISYIFPFNFHNDGERAMQLINLLPPGFKLSTEGTPNVIILENPFSNHNHDNPYNNPFFLNPFKKRIPGLQEKIKKEKNN